VKFLEDESDRNLPRTFVFDHLNFYTAETRITPESVPTVDDLLAILRAYPAVDVRLEGHTDAQGDPAANQKLSLDRATAIRALLVGRGLAERRIATAGFGQEKPVASNGTEEGRARNRRLELVVVKK
jgi:outer membrane protein OmpA-like peptidoglycan-associated protein